MAAFFPKPFLMNDESQVHSTVDQGLNPRNNYLG